MRPLPLGRTVGGSPQRRLRGAAHGASRALTPGTGAALGRVQWLELTMDQQTEGARVASHRMSDRDRPRRAVPAWVVAPPPGADDDGREARPTSAAHPSAAGAVAADAAPAPVATVASAASVPGVLTGPLPDGDVVVPDYPPQEHLLPPAPTSPAVQVAPFDTAPLPVSPAEATGTPLTPPTDPSHPAATHPVAARPAPPAAPVVGQPRFSVPGLEHVVVEGSEPEPVGPIGYRTPARFARQQAPRPVEADPATVSFDAVIAPPAAPTPAPTPFPVLGAPAPTTTTSAAADGPTVAPVETRPEAAAGGPDEGAPGLPAEGRASRDRSRTAIGAAPAAALGTVTGVAALGLAAWWFTAPATVHATGLVLGLLALVLSGTALRRPSAAWQRPVALLGAVLGGVGTLVLLWALATALLSLAGVTLPDLTGTGTVPTVAP